MSAELNHKTPTERAEDTRRAIVWYRRNRLISQVKMAAALGVSRALYNRIETGSRDVTIGELCTIADTLGIDVLELIKPDEAE